MAMRCLIKPAIILLAFAAVDGLAHAQSPQAERLSKFQTPFQQTSAKSDAAVDSGDRHLDVVKKRFPLYSNENVKKLVSKNPSDDKVRSLMKERCQAAFQELQARYVEYTAGRAPVALVVKASSRHATSLLALKPDLQTKLAILKHNVDVAKEIEGFADANLKVGLGTVAEVALAKYERLSAEILLEEAKASQPAKSPASSR